MGEKPSGRLLMVAGLLLASLFVSMVSADAGDVTLQFEEETPPPTPWYSPDHPLLLTPTLVNDGPDVSLTVNPACPFVFNVYNTTGTMLVNGSQTCPVREQGMDLFAGEAVEFEALEWSMKDADGAWLESGTYTVELLHSSGLSAVREVAVQTPVSIPEALTYSVTSTQRVNNDGPMVYMVNLHNPTSSSIDLSGEAVCFLEVQTGVQSRLGSSCFGERNALLPGEVILVDHVSVPAERFVSVSTPGGDFTYTHSPDAPMETITPSIDAALSVGGNQLAKFGPDELLQSEVLLTARNDAPSVVEFTSSCKAEMWVVDDLGNTVFDTRQGKVCSEIDLELTVGQEPERLTLPQWNFYLEDGCRIQPGTYTVIAEVPEHGLVASQQIEYASMEANPCVASSTADLGASLTWVDETTMSVAAVVSSEVNEYMRMAQPCTFEVEFLNVNNDVVHRFSTLCDAYEGRKVLLPTAEQPLEFDPLSISMVQDGQALVPDGEYALRLTVLSTSAPATSLPFSWPQDFAESVVDDATSDGVTEPFELLGTWMGIATEQGTCFAMDNDDETHLLSNAKTLPSWAPNAEVQGLYVVIPAEPSPACNGFLAPSVEVVEVRMEEALAAEKEPAAVVPVEELEPDASITPAIALVSVVVTASLLSLFVVAATTNEALRLPATLAGLWFLGLLGKTHETTDGRYQRGRLMGYLTANPGCHFRALMSALDMSNGQITHHLRVLESEEHVWRKNDGRLVRFYPLTNQLNPSTKEEDLPVPPLSPDPNSLQGKILNLLDQDGDLGQFPTQAELAKRLEKSQQLISHHLRTLQKFGLVERRKMGVKNRYKLTREAIFLLETSNDFVHEDIR